MISKNYAIAYCEIHETYLKKETIICLLQMKKNPVIILLWPAHTMISIFYKKLSFQNIFLNQKKKII